ncbi:MULTISPECIES: helix-turn-helix domain-containing protein [unclassified Crossiella]|uniref:helix-turn-helix domain-containing protein n=1 Tax=unclassified Crossiella TaxID=2620835 RepID=UPI001FFEE7B4|nr:MULTISPECIES: helix-turn-helix domain-containing protein [unclassified Crossiella]MCK2244504.1 helix-turn-helix domain-containing protein [Crossiella sp. S99.2]MCK2258135.1 helix-turn-helix domain-containing protein [Crossiella sp. S99.1]
MTEVMLRALAVVAADDKVVARVTNAARAHSPEVARLPEAENRRHIATLLAEGIAHLERGDAHEEGEFTAAQALGADRAAQGVSIGGLLRGVHAGRTELIRASVELARGTDADDATILDFIVDLDHYVGAVERHIISGYHTAELQLSRTARDLNTQVLRRLLVPDGDFPDAAELGRAGLRPAEQYHCVVSDVTDPGRARALEARLQPFGGVYGLVEGRLAGLAQQPPCWSDEDEVQLVVAPATALTALREVYPMCVRALAVAVTGVHRLTDLAGETALAAYPALAATLAAELMRPLDEKSGFHQEIAATALCYLDHGRRLTATATALHIHANTVRYRLDRLAELTEIDLSETSPTGRSNVLTTLHTWWALRTWLAGAAVDR